MPTDVRIKRTVWNHNRPFKPGQEQALREAGYSDEWLSEQVRRGAISAIARDADATDSARKLALEHDVSLSDVSGSGPKGRIYKTDVEDFIASRE